MDNQPILYNFVSPKQTDKGRCVCVCVFACIRLRKHLKEYPASDLDAPLIPIKMRAV